MVAASGAFPGAFQPKTIRWITASGDRRVQNRRFIDGGVVENLGLTGLDRYFSITKKTEKPDLLIISDASKRGVAYDLPVKVGALNLLLRSEEISYDSLHNEIYNKLNPDSHVLIRATDEDTIAALQSLNYKLKGIDVAGYKVAREVASYDTLKELSSEEVEKLSG
jgi:hypothetical protein